MRLWIAFVGALLLAFSGAVASGGTESPTLPLAGLVTAMTDPARLTGGDPAAFSDARAAGATVVRLDLYWNATAVRKPGAPANPDDPAYDWSGFDHAVTAAVNLNLTPIADVVDAPPWALAIPASAAGPGTPNATALGLFARAAAERYDGRTPGLPRVALWQVWNEPNLDTNISPQLVHGVPVSPGHYRAMVNAVAASVKAVDPNNLVIAGGVAPFRDTTPDTAAQNSDWGPLSFMRDLLCLSATLAPTCHNRVRFDVWSTHPYTSGGPTHHAVLPNDVSLGDLPKMSKVLSAAEAVHHIESSGPIRFWVTEFSWDSKPPSPGGVPTALLDRWVPQALYVMWSDGVSLVTWFSVDDDLLSQSFYQSGLYYHDGKAKPYREGFRFPFVAFPSRGGVYVWGRTPWGKPGSVTVAQRVGDAPWTKIGTLQSNADGIFQKTFHVAASGSLRARMVSTGERTLPFSLTTVPDQFFNPFGETTLLEPTPAKK